MNEPQWDKPDDFFVTFRCMKQKYGVRFLLSANIFPE